MKYILSLFMMSLLFIACDDDPKPADTTGNVDLALKLQYDGAPLVMEKEIDYPDGKRMYFSRISFYLSEIELLSDQHNHDDALIKYCRLEEKHKTTEQANTGYVVSLTDIKSGDYTDVKFSVGVPAAENAKVPSDFPSSNDLSLSEHWPHWNSYIFCKVEGYIDLNGDNVPEESFVLHLGSDDALVPVSKNIAFNVGNGTTTTVDIPIDMKKFFQSENGIYDIAANPRLHQLSQKAVMLELANNLKTCF